jgi:hypothetical protein
VVRLFQFLALLFFVMFVLSSLTVADLTREIRSLRAHAVNSGMAEFKTDESDRPVFSWKEKAVADAKPAVNPDVKPPEPMETRMGTETPVCNLKGGGCYR